MDKYVGKRLDGRYEIQEIIGIGGMAVVYKAYDSIDDRTVAIKILKEELLENQEFRRRFKNESKAIAVLSHPNIVKVYDVGLGDRIQYIVMEHIDGITLKEYIKSQQIIGWKDALYFAEQVLKALQHAHDKGIVHRDIKPQNIILLPDGTIKVTDFGIARFSRSEHRTITDKAIGSVHYISPEQARGEITDEKTDLYSVGVLLYEMLTGRLPFDAESAVSVAIMQLQNEPTKPRTLNPAIPEGLEDIILRAMQKNKEQRYQSSAEMLRDIESFKQNPSIQFEYKYFVDSEPTKFVNVGDVVGVASGAVVAGTETAISPKDDPVARKQTVKPTPMPVDDDEEDDEPERKSAALPVLIGITVAVVIGIIALGWWLLATFIFPDDGTLTEAPDLVGKSFVEVQKMDEYKNIEFTEKKEYSTEVEAGIIISQMPAAGQPLQGKNEIVVVVSMGAKGNTVEDYSNRHIDTVTAELDQAGVQYVVSQVYSDTVDPGYVIQTSPAAGQSMTPDTVITVFYSNGPKPQKVQVGKYIGRLEAEAKIQIEGDGLAIGQVVREESMEHPAGYVIRQGLTEGTEVASGTPIDIVISSGKPVVIDMPVPAGAVKPFSVQVLYNGTAIPGVGGSGVDPTALSGSYQIVLSKEKNEALFKNAAATFKVVVKYSGNVYMTYNVNFATATASPVPDSVKPLPESVLADVKPVSITLTGLPSTFELEVSNSNGIQIKNEFASSADGSYTLTLKKEGLLKDSYTHDISVNVDGVPYGGYTIDFTTGTASRNY
ncbi:MAG: Stk1 family PASTA domain-containing Ser/Thr kinase [Clostridia bacterium]|nr:Stk1 family PASTA domain-containing Ser/Thr kinase [Clostridia bacterium]